MRHRRRATIENRVLAAVLSICLLSVLCFSAVTILKGYESKLAQERDKGEQLISYISWDIQQFGQTVGEEAILAGCVALENESLVIIDAGGKCLLGAESAAKLAESGGILTEQSDNVFGWRLCYTMDTDAFESSLLEEQKYVMLATVALLIITIQVGVFVSYGISQPVRRLAEVCTAVGQNPGQATPELIPTDVRGAETAQLAEAFRRMLEELGRYNTALQEQKALNSSIVENLPIGVVAYGDDGRVLLVNDKAAAMLADDEFTAGGQSLRLALERHLAHTGLPHDPIRLENAAGERRIYQIGVWRLRRDGPDNGTLCTIDDVTYDRMMEEKVSESEKLAYTGKLAAMLAHEIRNPLAGIRASIQVVSRGMERERDRMLCASVIGEVDRINVLIENLLDLSRKRESHKTLVELRGLFAEVLLLYSKIAENHGVTVTAEAAPGLELYADEAELKQVLVNLISNSLKAVGPDGHVTLGAAAGAAGIEMTVSDDGMGMDEQKLRSVQSGIATVGGAGRYGLAIVSRLLDLNGGEMQIISKPGGGTTIQMLFRRGTITDAEKEGL